MKDETCENECALSQRNLLISAPRKFIQIYFNKETKTVRTIQISSPSMAINWENPNIYDDIDQTRDILPTADLQFLDPSCIRPCDSFSTASSFSNSDLKDRCTRQRTDKERFNDPSSTRAYGPFRCINDFEFFSPTLSSIDLDDNPTVSLYPYSIDYRYKRIGLTKSLGSLCCIFPSYYRKSRRRVLYESDEDDWRKAFFGYQQLDKYLFTI